MTVKCGPRTIDWRAHERGKLLVSERTLREFDRPMHASFALLDDGSASWRPARRLRTPVGPPKVSAGVRWRLSSFNDSANDYCSIERRLLDGASRAQSRVFDRAGRARAGRFFMRSASSALLIASARADESSTSGWPTGQPTAGDATPHVIADDG